MSLFSQQNIAHVINVSQRYLAERHQTSLDTSTITEFVHEIFDEIGNHLRTLPLEEANKTIILGVKDRVFIQPAPVPLPESGQGEEVHDIEEDFFKKLQDLETQRTLPLYTANSTTANPITSQSSQAPPPPFINGANTGGTSIIYLPSSMTPTRISKPLVVNGAERMWEYFTRRSTLVWSGQIPADVVQLRLVSLLLPKVCSKMTPLVQLEITGAAGNSLNVVCSLASTGASAASDNQCGWDTWTPCADTFGELKTLASPWTIKIKDTYGTPLPMGDDGFSIKQTAPLLNGNLKILFDAGTDTTAIMRGSTLLVRPTSTNSKNDIYVNILNYDSTSCAAEIRQSSTALLNAKVLNIHAQPSIVLSMSTTATTATTLE